MFTGIVQKVALVQSLIQTSENAFILRISNPYFEVNTTDPIQLGESIANNGVCLTVTQSHPEYLQFDLSPETIQRSSLTRLTAGSKVNLERSLRMGDRLSGHWVQGHVDGTAKVIATHEVEKGYYDLVIEPTNTSMLKYCVKKGSLTVDGISLTIHDLGFEKSKKQLKFQIIPHTWAETCLPDLRIGDLVNIEVDLLAKYIERFKEYDAQTESRH